MVLDTPVVAQYVKMQGIKRTAADSGEFYGYSLYEFEIYAPEVQRPDAEVAQEVLDSIVVPDTAVKDFTLPVSGEQKTTIAWASTREDVIAVDAAGNAKVTLPAEETVVTLTATVTTGEVVLTKDFNVTVKSAADAPVDYEIYPQVQKITYGAQNFSYTNEVNVVKEAGVSEEAAAYLEKVLASHGMTAVYADELSTEKTNILLGIKGAAGAADSYFEDISYEAAALTDHTDGYILHVAAKDAGTFAVLGQDTSAVFFSLTTLDQMLEIKDNKASEVTIEDYADMRTRGFIEGYYGVPWSYEERAEQMRYGATQKMNTYIYAPKDDPYHRAQWATLYPEEDQAKIRMLADVARENNYDFIWTLHPGDSINLNSDADFQKAIAKLEQLYELGVRRFGVLFDDINSANASGQANFINRIDTEFVKAKGDVKPMVTVGTRYCQAWGASMTGYFKVFVQTLHDDVEIMWTGNNTMSEINRAIYEWPKQQIGIDRDMMIWWNYSVNDYDESKLQWAPLSALNPDLDNVTGFVSNPMAHAEANKQTYFGVADYCWNTADFDYEKSYAASFRSIAPSIAEELQMFAENVCNLDNGSLHFDESWDFTDLLAAFDDAVANEEDLTEAAAALVAKFGELKDACATILACEDYRPLLDEIDPWVRALEKVCEAGVLAVQSAVDLQNGKMNAGQAKEAYDTINAKMTEASSFTTTVLNGRKQAVTAGKKRLVPFVNNVMSSLLNINIKELPTSSMTATAGSEQATSGSEGPAKNVLDNNTSTIWHTVWDGTPYSNQWIAFHLNERTAVSGLKILPRQSGTNGIITKYEIYAKDGADAEWVLVTSGDWAGNSDWKTTFFDTVYATDIKLQTVASMTDSGKSFSSAAEIRLLAPKEIPVNKDALSGLVAANQDRVEADYTPDSWAAFESALTYAQGLLEDNAATQQQVDDAYDALEAAVEGLVPAANPDAPVVTGAPESGASRGTVTLTADKAVTWLVNGVETGRVSNTLRLSDEGSYSVVAVDAEGNRSETIVFAIDRTKPVLTATCAQSGYTNQDVTFTADEYVTFFNADEQIGEGTELVLTESGVYNIRAIDKAGNYTAYYRVTIIKEAPVLTGVPESGYARGSVTIRSDSKVIFTVNGVAAEDYGYGLRIIEEGAYTVKATDMAGNETEVSFTIDNTKPTFTATVPSGQLTNQDITLTANEQVNFVVNGITVATGTEYTIAQSGLTVVYVYDLAGNYGGGYKANIDKTAPVLSAVIEGTQAPVANGGFVQQGVTVKANEKSRFIVNDGEPTEIANFVKLRAEGTYTVKAMDELGNVSEPFVVVIDKTAPVLSSDDIIDGQAINDVTVQANEDVLFTVDGETADAYAAEIVVKGDGEHSVKAVDKAGNKSNVLTFTIASPQKVEISPVPQSIEYLSMGGMKITDEVNIVSHGDIDEATMPRLEKALAANGYTYTKSDAAVEGKTNILLTSDREHCAACSADLGIADMSAAEQKEGYVLQVSGGNITIVGADADGVFYGVVTLADILAQEYAEKTVAEVNVSDYPEIGTRGFIEGFYGYPWSHTDRMDLMAFGSEQKMNTYIYAPKDDPYHRAQWKELYPEKEAAQIAELAQAGHENNYNFVWTIHPGDSINFNSEADVEACKVKMQQLYDLGVRQFGIMFDDVNRGSMQQHADFINRIDTEFVKAKGDVKPIITVGKRYCQAWGDSMYSFRDFVNTLHDDIEIMWTGAATMSNISKEVFDWPKQQTGTDRDLMVWWNYPVNDYCDAKVLMGPMKNLNTNLNNVTGFVSNPMNQAHASMQALYGIADYTWNTDAYDYNRAFEGSFREIAPEVAEDLQVFASNSCYLKDDGGASGAFLFEESWYLKEDIQAIRDALAAGEDPTAYAEKLIPEFQKMIDACTNIKEKCENEALVKELDPFLDALKLLGEAGVASMNALVAAQSGDFAAWEPNSMEAVAKIAAMEECKVDRLKDNKPQRFTVDVGTQILKPFIVEMADESAYIIGAEEKPTEYDYSQAYISDNIALSSLGVKATASSYTTGSEGPQYAIDGRISRSKWCSTAARPYLTLDLGSEKTIKEYQIINCGHPEAGESRDWNTKSAQILASNDGVTFTVVDEFDGNKEDIITRTLAEPVTARYIRLQILEPNQGSVDGSGATRIYEFRLYDKVHAQQSIKILPADVEIANNAGATDTVTVRNLKEGDIVSLYTSIDAAEPFAVSAPVAAGETSVTMENLELQAEGGRIYMTCTNKSYLPSVKTSKGYAAE